MAYGMPPLNWLRAFEASARHMSFAQAARDLSLTSLHLPFGFELPVEQAHYLLTPTGRAGLRPEALLFREWIIAAAKTP